MRVKLQQQVAVGHRSRREPTHCKSNRAGGGGGGGGGAERGLYFQSCSVNQPSRPYHEVRVGKVRPRLRVLLLG